MKSGNGASSVTRLAGMLHQPGRERVSIKAMQIGQISPEKRYTYLVCWSEEDCEYVACCAQFPSLSWLAKKPEAALKGIIKTVKRAAKNLEAGQRIGVAKGRFEFPASTSKSKLRLENLISEMDKVGGMPIDEEWDRMPSAGHEVVPPCMRRKSQP